MFFNLANKVYITAKEVHRKYYNVVDNINLDEYLNLETYLCSFGNKAIQIVVPYNEMNVFINRYFCSLGLSYEQYSISYDFNKNCIKYMDEFRLCYGTTPKIDRSQWIYYDKIKVRDPKIFPAEFCINHLEEDWALHKYLYFMCYSIYNAIKELQLYYIQKGQKVPSILWDYATGNDQSAKRLFDKEERLKVCKFLLPLIKIDGIHSVQDCTDIHSYIKNSKDFGFIDTLRFKFNPILMKNIKNNGFKFNTTRN